MNYLTSSSYMTARSWINVFDVSVFEEKQD